jgi:hypothetical protein
MCEDAERHTSLYPYTLISLYMPRYPSTPGLLQAREVAVPSCLGITAISKAIAYVKSLPPRLRRVGQDDLAERCKRMVEQISERKRSNHTSLLLFFSFFFRHAIHTLDVCFALCVFCLSFFSPPKYRSLGRRKPFYLLKLSAEGAFLRDDDVGAPTEKNRRDLIKKVFAFLK